LSPARTLPDPVAGANTDTIRGGRQSGKQNTPPLRFRAHWGSLAGHCRQRHEARMTDRIALGLGLLIAVAIAADLLIYGTEHMIFLGKKIFELIEWLAFWR
jgi:hypothetical protein